MAEFFDGSGNKIPLSAPSALRGSVYVAFGDSIVSIQSTNSQEEVYTGTDLQGVSHQNEHVRGYIQDIEDRYGVTCRKFGDSGGTIIRNYAKAVAQDYSKVSLFTIAFGTNDGRTNVPLGTRDTQDVTTFAGALNGILRKVYMDNPSCKALVLTPPQRLTVNDFGSFTPNGSGKTLEDFANMAKAVAQKRSTLCADIFHASGLNQQTLYSLTREGVHPLNEGYKHFSNVLIPLIDGLLSVPGELSGKAAVPGSPLSDDPAVTEVLLTADLFTKPGVDWNTSDGASAVEEMTQTGKGIKLLPGKTYLYTYYSTYDGLPERKFAVNDNADKISGTSCWDKWTATRGFSAPEKVQRSGGTYYKFTSAFTVPAGEERYIWPAMYNALGADSLSLRYF